jgi:hypothetical protein
MKSKSQPNGLKSTRHRRTQSLAKINYLPMSQAWIKWGSWWNNCPWCYNRALQKNTGIVANLILNCSKKWILYSGATNHITGNKNLIKDFTNWNTTRFVTVANGNKMKIIRIGSIDLFSKKYLNIFLVQNCPANLLFITKIAQELNCEIILTSKRVIF